MKAAIVNGISEGVLPDHVMARSIVVGKTICLPKPIYPCQVEPLELPPRCFSPPRARTKQFHAIRQLLTKHATRAIHRTLTGAILELQDQGTRRLISLVVAVQQEHLGEI